MDEHPSIRAASSMALGIPRKKERRKKTENGMYIPIYTMMMPKWELVNPKLLRLLYKGMRKS